MEKIMELPSWLHTVPASKKKRSGRRQVARSTHRDMPSCASRVDLILFIYIYLMLMQGWWYFSKGADFFRTFFLVLGFIFLMVVGTVSSLFPCCPLLFLGFSVSSLFHLFPRFSIFFFVFHNFPHFFIVFHYFSLVFRSFSFTSFTVSSFSIGFSSFSSHFPSFLNKKTGRGYGERAEEEQ